MLFSWNLKCLRLHILKVLLIKLQIMGHSDIGVTLNTYTHLGLEDAEDELKRLEDLKNARKELERTQGEKPVSQKMFKAI